MGKTRTFIVRHILEVRFKQKNFSFLDYYGELIDAIHAATKFEKVKVEGAGARVELASEDLSKTYFFSLENFGFQLDAEKDIESFRTNATKILTILSDFSKYEIKDPLRIGTKSTFFCNIPSRSEEGIREIFFNKMFANKQTFEQATGLEISDIAFAYLDAKNSQVQSHIMTGPSNLNEVIEKFFSKPKLYKDFGKESGVFYETDTYSEELGKLDVTSIAAQISSQIGLIEKGFEGYMDLFNEKTR